jgi:hypothetical protein
MPSRRILSTGGTLSWAIGLCPRASALSVSVPALVYFIHYDVGTVYDVLV